MLQFSLMDTLGIYVQVPFCQTKCTYCNFHTGVVSQQRFAPYIAAVQQQIASTRADFLASGIPSPESFPPVDTVYIGGGTPSLLDPQLLADLLTSLRHHFPGAAEEITLEADPETVEYEKARQWLAAGINRISFGSQSFVDDELKAAGRMHRRADIDRAVSILRAAGLTNLSFDLIAGLPKQTAESWQYSLAQTITLSPEHVSIYMMEIDQGSRLGLEALRGGARYSARELPGDEAMADFYALAQRQLKSAGYDQYEISNWARPGFASRHNLKYWRREPYLGYGAGAHSFFGTQRWANLHDPAAFVAAIAAGQPTIESVRYVTPEEALEEEIFLGLRQMSGIDLGRIERQYRVDFTDKVRRLASTGMVQRNGQRLRLAPDKLNVSNEILVELLR
jgi:oxygen-independent coproporphyrinogen III oxidase